MLCDAFRLQLNAYLAEELEGEDRAAFRDHLRQCPRCRAEAAAVEPTLLLLAAPAPEADPRRVADCTLAVAALIRQDRLQRRLRPHRRTWWAAAAAVLLAALTLLWQALPERGRGAAAVAAVATTPTAAVDDAPPPQVEVDMPGEGVRIYQFATDQDRDTAVLFIVNPALES